MLQNSAIKTLNDKICRFVFRSSSSYLLFNTAENPYGNLSAYIDPFDARSKKVRNLNLSDKPDSGERHGLQEAPSSLSNIRGLDDPYNENFYIPVKTYFKS